MKSKFILLLLFFVMIIQGCEPIVSTSKPSLFAQKTLTYVSATIIVGVAPGPPSEITLTPPTSDQNTIIINLSVYNSPPDPVIMKSSQKLIIFPPSGWGEYGWKLTFDNSFFEIDKQNEPKWPSQGWWIWTPLHTGKSIMSISAMPLPCQKTNPPCDFPEYSVNLNVEVKP